MIRYSLHCDQGHDFDSWFASAEAFDRLAASGHLACAICGGSRVTKALMAPSVAKSEPERPLSQPASPAEAAMAELRKRIEENSDYVGLNFAAEARAMHEGDSPERAIWGEAKPEDARQLIEDGIPVAPLPFLPPRKTN
ncbi:DUF1178 family protein [Frigidibacter sp. MR17.14]|uniref:DUF1178 family protein n=1 Tax=Frigidibacter sp. MR17.14 TaxID=3126509 RepID=UPI003012CA0C